MATPDFHPHKFMIENGFTVDDISVASDMLEEAGCSEKNMPLMFSVMFFFFPAGLVLYWCTNNILSIAQQWIINKRMGVPPQFNLRKFK